MFKKMFTFSRFTLFVALCISAIAAYYSVIGLTAIFAGAIMPIIIMGAILEIAKITTTVWLHKFWAQAGWAIRTYLTIAVIALALLTSMGIFGLLSKAHLDQNVPTGDVAAKVALIDEKIRTQRENVDLARKALTQLDSQVDQRLSRGESEVGAERAIQIRRQQGPERAKLIKEISDAQSIIAKLNEDRAPIASQLRKVEAEVGPIKYIAALIYGDNPDINTLERAVRWVIIMIVVVFDPLAIILILAANNSIKWEKESSVEIPTEKIFPEYVPPTPPVNNIDDSPVQSAETILPLDTKFASENISEKVKANEWKQFGTAASPKHEVHKPDASTFSLDIEPVARENIQEKVAVSNTTKFYPAADENNPLWDSDWSGLDSEYMELYSDEQPLPHNESNLEEKTKSEAESDPTINCHNCGTLLMNAPGIGMFCPNKDCHISDNPYGLITVESVVSADKPANTVIDIKTEGVTLEAQLYNSNDGYLIYEGKQTSIAALREIKPELLIDEKIPRNSILFGVDFPQWAVKGDVYTRTDVVPHRTYKFNGSRWIQIDKAQNPTYLQNVAYLQFLISKLNSGEYDLDMLTEVEQEEISDYLERTV